MEAHTVHEIDSMRAAIAESGLFDPQFYRATYGDDRIGIRDPLIHFLESGLAKGYLPSEHFDPVLYRVLVPGCGRENPLVHYINNHSGRFSPPPLSRVFPEICRRLKSKKKIGFLERQVHRARWLFSSSKNVLVCGTSPRQVERNRRHARTMADARTLTFKADGKTYRLKVPSPEFFIDRLRNDVPFSLVRLPEGFWSACNLRQKTEVALKGDARSELLTREERRALAARICLAMKPQHGAFIEAFMDEVLDRIDEHVKHPDFFRSFSFKGYPTWDDRVFPPHLGWKERRNLTKVYARHFSDKDQIFDSTLIKRLLIAGHLKDLPALCSQRHVILVASDIFENLDERWGLKRFTHVRIPRSLSQSRRWSLLEEIKLVIDEAAKQEGPRPIVLTQCGGSLAFWLRRFIGGSSFLA